MRWKAILAAIFLATAGFSIAQSPEEEDRNFALGTLGLKMQQEGEGKDYCTASLILLAKLEDVYHHIELHRKDIAATLGPMVFFDNPPLDLAFEQKMDAVRKAAQSIEKLISLQSQRLRDGINQMRGGNSSG